MLATHILARRLLESPATSLLTGNGASVTVGRRVGSVVGDPGQGGVHRLRRQALVHGVEVELGQPIRYGLETDLIEMPINWALDDYHQLEFQTIQQRINNSNC